MKDWRGTEITPGDTIVYPGRHSSSLWMTEGEVLAVHGESRSTDYGYSQPARLVVQPVGGKKRKVVLTAIGNVTVVRSLAQHERDIKVFALRAGAIRFINAARPELEPLATGLGGEVLAALDDLKVLVR